jgi:hypothetical protein
MLCTVAAASYACRLALSKGLGAHPVSALYTRLRAKGCNFLHRLQVRFLKANVLEVQVLMFFIVIHAAGKVPEDTD